MKMGNKKENKISLESYVSFLKDKLQEKRKDIHYHCDIKEFEKFEDLSLDEKRIPSFHVIKEYFEVIHGCRTEAKLAIIAVCDYVESREYESALTRKIRLEMDIFSEKISRVGGYYYDLVLIKYEPQSEKQYEKLIKKEIEGLINKVVVYRKILNSREFSLADERLRNDIELTALGLKEKYEGK